MASPLDELKPPVRTAPSLLTGLNPPAGLRAPVVEEEEDKGDVIPGIKRSLANAQSTYGSVKEVVGELTGNEELAASGGEIRERAQAKSAENAARLNFTDIRSLGDAADWAQGTLAEQGPQFAGQVASGYLGGKLGVGIGALTGPFAPVAVPVLGAIGAGVGYAAPSILMGIGEAQSAIKERGGTNAPAAVGIGVASGAIDAIPAARVGRAIKGLGKQLGKQTAKKAGRDILETAAFEGGTEGIQDNIIEYGAAKATDTDYEFNLKNTINAVAAGALVGGTATGAVRAAGKLAPQPAPPIAIPANIPRSPITDGAYNAGNVDSPLVEPGTTALTANAAPPTINEQAPQVAPEIPVEALQTPTLGEASVNAQGLPGYDIAPPPPPVAPPPTGYFEGDPNAKVGTPKNEAYKSRGNAEQGLKSKRVQNLLNPGEVFQVVEDGPKAFTLEKRAESIPLEEPVQPETPTKDTTLRGRAGERLTKPDVVKLPESKQAEPPKAKQETKQKQEPFAAKGTPIEGLNDFTPPADKTNAEPGQKPEARVKPAAKSRPSQSRPAGEQQPDAGKPGQAVEGSPAEDSSQPEVILKKGDLPFTTERSAKAAVTKAGLNSDDYVAKKVEGGVEMRRKPPEKPNETVLRDKEPVQAPAPVDAGPDRNALAKGGRDTVQPGVVAGDEGNAGNTKSDGAVPGRITGSKGEVSARAGKTAAEEAAVGWKVREKYKLDTGPKAYEAMARSAAPEEKQVVVSELQEQIDNTKESLAKEQAAKKPSQEKITRYESWIKEREENIARLGEAEPVKKKAPAVKKKATAKEEPVVNPEVKKDVDLITAGILNVKGTKTFAKVQEKVRQGKPLTDDEINRASNLYVREQGSAEFTKQDVVDRLKTTREQVSRLTELQQKSAELTKKQIEAASENRKQPNQFRETKITGMRVEQRLLKAEINKLTDAIGVAEPTVITPQEKAPEKVKRPTLSLKGKAKERIAQEPTIEVDKTPKEIRAEIDALPKGEREQVSKTFRTSGNINTDKISPTKPLKVSEVKDAGKPIDIDKAVDDLTNKRTNRRELGTRIKTLSDDDLASVGSQYRYDRISSGLNYDVSKENRLRKQHAEEYSRRANKPVVDEYQAIADKYEKDGRKDEAAKIKTALSRFKDGKDALSSYPPFQIKSVIDPLVRAEAERANKGKPVRANTKVYDAAYARVIEKLKNKGDDVLLDRMGQAYKFPTWNKMVAGSTAEELISLRDRNADSDIIPEESLIKLDKAIAAKQKKPAAKKQRLTPKQSALQRTYSIDPDNDDLLTAISKLGGIDVDTENDWAGRLSHIKMPAFKNKIEQTGGNGRSLDDLTQALTELGYIKRDETGNYDQTNLSALLEIAETGEKVPSLQGLENQYIEQAENDAIDKMAMEISTKSNIDINKVQADIDAMYESGSSPQQVGKALDVWLTEVNKNTLTTYDEKDLAQRDKAVKDKALADKDAISRAEENAKVGSFTLTGSDREADVAASKGQQNLLDDLGISSWDEYSRKPAKGAVYTGMPKARTQKIVNRIARKWTTGPQVEVVQNVRDIPDLDPDLAGDTQVQGVYRASSGKVYVVAGAAKNARGVERLLLHEAQHHAGRTYFGDEATNRMAEIGTVMDKQGGIKEFVKNNKLDYDYDWYESRNKKAGFNENQRKARHVDEMLAVLAESNNNTVRRLARQAITAIRKTLRKMGFELSASLPTDQLIEMLNESQRVLKGAKPLAPSTLPKQPLDDSPSRRPRDIIKQATANKESLKGKWKSSQLKRYMTKEGWMGPEAFKAKTVSDAQKNEGEAYAGFHATDLKNTMTKAYKVKRYSQVPKAARKQVMDYITLPLDQKDSITLDPDVKAAANEARRYVNNLSGKMMDSLKEIIDIQQENLPDAQKKAIADYEKAFRAGEPPANEIKKKIPSYILKNLEVRSKIDANIDSYLHRSFQAFDDPKWAKKVLADKALMARAKAYIAELNPELTPIEVEGEIKGILDRAVKDNQFLSFFARGQQQGKKDISILRKRNEAMPQVILDLLGEYDDPVVNFDRTVTKMTWYIANHNFLMTLREQGLDEKNGGANAFMFRRKTGDHHRELATIDNETLSPLGGLYATPEFEQGLKDAVGTPEESPLMRQFVQINSAVKYGKTVGAPATQIRNFVSAGMFTIMNGHFNYAYAKKAWQVTWADLITHDKTFRDEIVDLVAKGVLHNNPFAGELKDAINEFADYQAFASSMSKSTNTVQATKAKAKAFAKFIQKTYAAGDDFWKYVGYHNELDSLIKSGMEPKEAQAMAVDRIVNGYPTYSFVPLGIKRLRRWVLIGTFVSFPYEIMRTSVNQARFVYEDAKAGRKAMAAKRLIGMSMASSAAALASKLSMELAGLGDEDDEAIRNTLPPWSRNSQLYYMDPDEFGSPTYVDLSYLDPYTYLKKPITAFLNDNNEGFYRKAKDSFMEIADPFIGVDILAGALGETAFNKKLQGGSIYNPADTAPRQALDIFHHLRKAVQPGAFSNGERIIKALEKDTSPSGKEYKLGEELKATVGFRTGTVNLRQAMIYRSYEFNDRIRNATTILSRKAGQQNKLSPAELTRAFNAMTRARRQAFSDMSKLLQGARQLNVPDRELAILMKAAGIGEANRRALLQGKTPPWMMSKRFIKSAQQRAILSTLDKERKLIIARELADRKKLIQGLQEAERLLLQRNDS